MANYTALASMKGDKYQYYYALFLMLKELDKSKDFGLIKNLSVRIEGDFDDIELYENDRLYKLIQTKHLTGKSLSDSSEHFWKTIRIWSDHIVNNKVSIDNVTFSFVVTLKASPKSILELLNQRKIDETLSKMEKLIQDSRVRSRKKNEKNINKEELLNHNEKAFIAFENLGDRKKKLLEAIETNLSEPDLDKLKEKIKNWLIIPIRHEYIDSCFDELMGWWESKININFPIIALAEIHNKILDLSNEYSKNSLPIRFEGKNLELPSDYEDQNFVKQLRSLQYTDRIELAKLDYYRAKLERSHWENDIGCIDPEDIIEYECILNEGWKQTQSNIYDDFKFEHDIDNIKDVSDEKLLKKIGRKIYEQTLQENIPFKKNTLPKYVMCGSYHELANKPKPKVYWHPKFIDYLNNKGQ
ncbi:MAG: ABC-three component system protein [Methylococcaceae bacterium]